MIKLNELNIKIFADGADLKSFQDLNSNNFIKGFTTNPSLMKKSGIKNYKEFAQDLIKEISDKPISFEVFEDELINMEKQARQIATWGKNVFVKIPVTNTKGESTHELVKKLSDEGISCISNGNFYFWTIKVNYRLFKQRNANYIIDICWKNC